MPKFIGPNGAKFTVKEGGAFTKEDIDRKVESGEWQPVVEDKPKPAAKKSAPAKAKK